MVEPVPAEPDATPDGVAAVHYRHVLGHFATGVVVVTAMDGTEPVGFSCQSFASVSLQPPLVSFCPSNTSTSWPRIEAAGRFCANVLAEDQEEICRLFATSGAAKFDGVGWRRSPGGAPLLDGAIAWVDATIEAVHPAGDHVIVVGRVTDLDVARHGRPLVFYRGGFGWFDS